MAKLLSSTFWGRNIVIVTEIIVVCVILRVIKAEFRTIMLIDGIEIRVNNGRSRQKLSRCVGHKRVLRWPLDAKRILLMIRIIDLFVRHVVAINTTAL